MSDYRQCAKCGATTEQRPYYSRDGFLGFARVGWGECLIRRCSRCGYTTSEPTADAPSPGARP